MSSDSDLTALRDQVLQEKKALQTKAIALNTTLQLLRHEEIALEKELSHVLQKLPESQRAQFLTRKS